MILKRLKKTALVLKQRHQLRDQVTKLDAQVSDLKHENAEFRKQLAELTVKKRRCTIHPNPPSETFHPDVMSENEITDSIMPPATIWPAGKLKSVLIRDPDEAIESCRREGWQSHLYKVRSVFVKGDAVRVVMNDGRSGTVQWDMI